jgi:tetratricopeptide (TPR) repeat protein
VDVSPELIATYRSTSFAKELRDYNEIIDQCDRAIASPQRAGDQAYATRLKAWALNRRGEVLWDQATATAQLDESLRARAIEDFYGALSADPGRWRAMQNLGIVEADAGRWEEALAQFDRVIELQPAYPNAYFNRAEVRLQMGEPELALADYQRAIDLDGEQADFDRGRGHALFELGRYGPAVEDFSHAVSLTPQDAERYVDRGDALQSLGRWVEAEQDYRRALNLDRNLADALRNLAWLLATCPEQSIRRGNDAVQLARLANAAAGETAEYRFAETLAAAYAETGQWGPAEEQIRRAIAQAPEEERPALAATLEQVLQHQPIRQAPIQ